jgi:hypothetical protein
MYVPYIGQQGGRETLARKKPSKRIKFLVQNKIISAKKEIKRHRNEQFYFASTVVTQWGEKSQLFIHVYLHFHNH